MGSPGHSVVVRHRRRRPDNYVADPGLTSTIALPVIAREPLHHHDREIVFPAHENPVPGNKDVIQDSQHLLPTKSIIANIDIPLLEFACITGLPSVDQVHALGICWYGAAHRIVLVLLRHSESWHDKHFMRVHSPCLVCLCPSYYDAVASSLDNVDEHVQIHLLAWAQSPITLDISHGTLHTQVIPLNVGQPRSEPLMILGSVFLIHFVGSAENGVHGIHAHASLEAAARPLPQQPL